MKKITLALLAATTLALTLSGHFVIQRGLDWAAPQSDGFDWAQPFGLDLRRGTLAPMGLDWAASQRGLDWAGSQRGLDWAASQSDGFDWAAPAVTDVSEPGSV